MKKKLSLLLYVCICAFSGGSTAGYLGPYECKKIIYDNVMPVIIVGDYWKTRPGTKYKHKDSRDVRAKLADDLYVHYAVLGEYGISLITYHSLKQQGLDENNLKKTAIDNLKKYFSCIGGKIERSGSFYHVTPLTQFYSASIMLLEEHWSNLGTKGNPVVFLHGDHGSIKIVDSHDQDAVLKASVDTLYFGTNPDGTPKVSRKVNLSGYVYKKGKWFKFNPPNKPLQTTAESSG